MMFLFHTAGALELIAFLLGIGLLVWSFRHDGKGIILAKITGFIIAIIALLGFLCTTYYGIQYWKQDYFKTPDSMMMQQQMMNNPMMQKMMQSPMMGAPVQQKDISGTTDKK